jgi:hypothetical protein
LQATSPHDQIFGERGTLRLKNGGILMEGGRSDPEHLRATCERGDGVLTTTSSTGYASSGPPPSLLVRLDETFVTR